MKKLIICLLILIIGLNQRSFAQIFRGAASGEIYITNSLFFTDTIGQINWGLFHSYDNGKHLSCHYHSPINTLRLIGDPIPGKIYGCIGDTMWISDNYGVSWSNFLTDIPVTCSILVGGNGAGELYLEDKSFKIYKSSNYGQTLIQVNDSLTLLALYDVGAKSGTLFARNFHPQSYDPSIRISHDYGQTFSIQKIDTGFMSISRGTQDKELYLVNQTSDTSEHYQIYQSFDEGMTLVPRTKVTIPVSWRFSCSAGRSPGSFYVLRSKYDGYSTYTCIDYSSDSAKTFTSTCYYLHDLLSINDLQLTASPLLLQNTPNPFKYQTTINFYLPDNGQVKLVIYDIYGRQIKNLINSKLKRGNNSIQWYGTNDSGVEVPSGIYIYSLMVGDVLINTKKMILNR